MNDELIQATMWSDPGADPIADIKAMMAKGIPPMRPAQPPIWPAWIVREHPEAVIQWEKDNGFRKAEDPAEQDS